MTAFRRGHFVTPGKAGTTPKGWKTADISGEGRKKQVLYRTV